MSIKVAGLGELLWDLLPSGAQLGGAPANFAYHAQALGAQASVVSRVGEDELGHAALKRLSHLGLSAAGIQRDSVHPTGTGLVTLGERGLPSYEFPPAAWDYIERTEVARDLVRGADAVCFGSLAQRCPGSRASIQALMAEVSPKAFRIFDVNLRPVNNLRETLEVSLRQANVLKLNEEELTNLALLFGLRPGHTREQLEQLLDLFPLRGVIWTAGAEGSLVCLDGQWSQQPPRPVQVVDTVGAGDAFLAAFIVGTLNGWSLSAAHEAAAEVARYVCLQSGATPVLPASILEKFGRKLV